MDDRLDGRFWAVHALKLGLVLGDDVSYSRMLYLSAVTIATLGTEISCQLLR